MRANPDQIARAKEVDLAALVARHVKLARRGRWLVGLCPFHKEKSPSFKVENGRYHCFGCGADGDTIQWVQASSGMPFRDAVESLSGDGFPKARQRIIPPNSDGYDREQDGKIKEAREIWARAQAVRGTRAAEYLFARGIIEPNNPSLRYLPAFPYAPGILLPAMVAALVSPARQITAVQITWLSPVKPEKAAVATCRKTYGTMGEGAVRLGKTCEKLGIAEGVETGLSAMQITGIPVWCCLGAPRMHRISIPEQVSEIVLFGDNDGPGREAVARTHLAHARRRVVDKFPPDDMGDWNDAARQGCRPPA